jgi:oligoendopeptidase F
MFAEFELETHKRAEKGETLTGADFSKIYLELLKKYHGHDQKTCEIDDLYGIEWAYIPHFYYNFYVYQYSTGQVASTAIAEKVMAGEPGAVESYLAFLKSGSSVYPADALKKAGVDLTTSTPFEITRKSFNRTMDRIEEILKTMGK